MPQENYQPTTQLLHLGREVPGMALYPESLPVFLTSAYTMGSMEEVHATYAKKEQGFTYSRKRNPNRSALEEQISYLEQGEDSLCFQSGMAAISCVLLKELRAGDQVLCNAHIYGETAEVFRDMLAKFDVECCFLDFADLEALRRAVRPNTRLFFTEVLSNPTLRLTDIGAVAALAHENGALLLVDNTFTTPLAIQPYLLGADYVFESLTKFLNGHSDASGGSVTANSQRIDGLLHFGMMCGGTGDPFGSWLISRGLQTAQLRIYRQMESAALLVRALEDHSRVTRVYHPCAKSYEQTDLARRLFPEPEAHYSAIFTLVLPEDRAGINAFLSRLRLARYAPTLGGSRTTLSHSITSSHAHMPDEERRKIGITPGMIRVSVGLEAPEDLLADFLQAMEVFD